jgi:hemoglobin/transferrin/lactoferrin receptor protein
MMKKILALWVLLVAFTCSNAQIVTVTDQDTNDPIELVMIINDKNSSFEITNIEGQADLSSFVDASKIQFKALGFETLVFSYSELKNSGMKVNLKKSNFTFNNVVISASKWSQESRNVPSKVTIITPKNAQLLNPQTAADLLGSSGEVFIQKSQQGGGSPMIRGFSTNRLLYAIDGVRMNTAIFRGGNLQNVISLDPFATERTEVLFGPGSVIYGSDAIGGVMSFQTLTPQLSLSGNNLISGKAVTRYSSANSESTQHFDINVGWKKWAILTSISSNDFSDLKMGSKGPTEYLRPFYVERHDSIDVIVTNQDPRIQKPSGYSQMNLMQKIRFKPNDKWDIQYGLHYSETSDYSRYDRHIRYRDGLPRYGEWYYGPQIWRMNNLNITNSSSNKIYDAFTLRLAEQYFEESRISRDINKPDRERRIEEVQAYSINLDFTKKIKDKHHLAYGLEYVSNDVTSIGWNDDISAGTTVEGATRYPQSTWNSMAAYLSDTYTISDKFLMTAGLRYNQYALDAVFDTTFYPFPLYYFRDGKCLHHW